MVGGTLYFNTPLSIGAAVDARTGAHPLGLQPAQLRGRHHDDDAALEPARRRLLAATARDERIYWGTGDGYLIAVDAKTGKPVPGFGANGRVDLMDGLPRAKRGARDYLNALTYSVQSPPIVVRDVIIVPASISSLVSQKEQIPGYIRGYDVRTGPGPLDLPHRAAAWRVRPRLVEGQRLGVRRQGHGVDDDERRRGARLRLPADQHHRARLLRRPPPRRQPVRREPGLPRRRRPASASGTSRPCTTACGTTTTRPRRTCSTSPWTAAASRRWRRSPSRASSTPSTASPAQPVWPIDEKPVPPSDVPGERASPTQPFPTKPAPFEYQGVTPDDLVDFTPELRADGPGRGQAASGWVRCSRRRRCRARSRGPARSAAATGPAPRSIPRPG